MTSATALSLPPAPVLRCWAVVLVDGKPSYCRLITPMGRCPLHGCATSQETR